MLRSLQTFAVATLIAALPSVALADGPVTVFLKSQHARVTKLLKEPAKTKEATAARDAKISAIVTELLDYQKLSEAALEGEWAKRTPKEREEFVGLLQKLVERNYRSNLQNTLDYTINYVDEKPEGDLVVVTTTARDKNKKRSPSVTITYRLEKRKAEWAVIDVITDDVSMVSNYRSQFRRIIKKDGWAGLMERMHKRMADGSSADL